MDDCRRKVHLAVAALLLALAISPGPVEAAEVQAPSCAQGPARDGDVIVGTPCADTIVAPPGVADVKAGGGNDVIVPAAIVAGSSCPEGCRLGIGSQTFEGGPGDDVVYGERGNDRLYGGEGNDRLYGGIGDDLLRGGPGDDLLAGGFGADAIDGEEGSDYVRGDGTQDTIVDTGVAGNDTLSYSTGIAPGFFEHSLPHEEGLPGRGERGVYLDLTADLEEEGGDNGVAGFGGGVDKVEGADFETIVGSPFSDYIVGGQKGETIYGGGGADVILGERGDDTIHGGAAGDYLDGGEGNDRVDGDPGEDRCLGAESSESCERGTGGVLGRDSAKVDVGLMTPGEGSFAQLYLVGSEASDEVVATYESSAARVSFDLSSSASFDTAALVGSGCEASGVDRVTCSLDRPLDSLVMAGLGGEDVLRADGFPESVGVVVLGGGDNDHLVGGEQSEDVLADGSEEGGPGDDVLEGLGGDDALLHNGGEDELLGGAGNDLFLSNSICDGDLIEGGPDRDNASWGKFKEAVDVRLDRGEAGKPGAGYVPSCTSGAPDSLTGIEDLEGTQHGDALYGDGGENQLLGWAGPDTYVAGAGDDRILANSGDYDPTIECGEGDDTALIDFPVLEPHDVAAPDCEHVQEAPPNSFRVETELEAPPPPAPATEPSPASAQKKGHRGHSASRPTCLGVTRSGGGAAATRCAVRPRRLHLGRDSALERIRWRSWAQGSASGFGRLVVRRRRAPLRALAKVVLYRSRTCGSRAWYTRIRVRYGRSYRRTFHGHAVAPTPCAARLRRDGRHSRGQRG